MGTTTQPREVRNYGTAKWWTDIPSLTETQEKFYADFLRADSLPEERSDAGLEHVFRTIFPIASYDGKIKLEYVSYELGEPRHNPDECRALGLSYAAPLKIKTRLVRGDAVIEEDVYLGEIPLMIGGGEFIVNGAERVIVTQIQRSPGVDFGEEIHSSGKRLYSCRVIPEHGSWIQVETSSKDVMTVRIDRSSKIPVTCFLRALSEKHSTDRQILGVFFEVEEVALAPKAVETLPGAWLVEDAVDPETGEVLAEGMKVLDRETVEILRNNKIKSISVVRKGRDEIMLKTLAEDESDSHESALMKIYMRLRPGSPPRIEKAKEFFAERFFDPNRYYFGKIGRFRINRKFGSKVDSGRMTLTEEDFLNAVRYILTLRGGQGEIDDIDHLENRRIRTIYDLVGDEFRKGMLKLSRSVRERMSLKDAENLTPRSLINSQTVSLPVEYFFARGELSQVVDQTNPLAQLTHERRLSALGPGGLNRKRAGFEVRDVHPSHYGRICPIETPEGTNIGLIVSLSIYASINEYGFLVTPYVGVKNGRPTGDVSYLRADEEREVKIAQAPLGLDPHGKIVRDKVMIRYKEEFGLVDAGEVQYADVFPNQLVGVAASLIPFLEHDDANRALMGSNMQRQAVPLLRAEPPIVATGMEATVARNSGMVLVAAEDGLVEYADALRIVVGGREYKLRKYFGLNEGTCLNQKPIVREGQKVKKGDVLTGGAATAAGELALGRDALVAFMSWEGCNFEDAILVSERLLQEDSYTSIHIEEFSVEVRETKLGREELTRDIPNVSEAALRNLDEWGLVRVGTKVTPGDILVGKVAPKSKSELSSEEKLLHAIFGRAGEDVRNESLEAKPGVEGYVIDVQHFSRHSPISEDEKSRARKFIKQVETDCEKRIAAVVRAKHDAIREAVGPVSLGTSRKSYRIADSIPDAEAIAVDDQLDLDKVDLPDGKKRKAKKIAMEFNRRRRIIEVERERKIDRTKRGDELPTGVLELVKVYIAIKRTMAIGDKLAGRHGNKGVVSRILPVEDMPFLEDGTPVDMVLNPLGVPSRMNFGQILETHLGWAAKTLNFKAITPVFDGAKEENIRAALREAKLPEDGKAVLYDGRTGERFDQKVAVGYMYMMKLDHLVADKLHARATGPYSLITQQPLGGKARSGGQRFGEMEVWALEAYGAANILQELLTVKSDDVEGRTKIYESMIKGENSLEPGTPVSFEVLCNEIRGLGLKISLEKNPNKLPAP